MTENRFTADAIARRQAYVVGQPPRIAPLRPEELTQSALDTAARIAGAAGSGASVKSASDVPEILATMLRHPTLTEKLMGLSIHLYTQSTLSPRDRELLVLRTEWLCQTPFEWSEHVAISKAVGVSSDEIERITDGSTAPGWNEDDRALIRAAEELHATAMISDEVWAILAKRLNEQQLFELTVVVGYYTLVAYFENALRLRLRAGNVGLGAR